MKLLRLRVLEILGVSLNLVSVVSAANWHAPGNFGTIQAAINDSDMVTGDRIIVGPGNHAGVFVTKEVEIRDDRYLG